MYLHDDHLEIKLVVLYCIVLYNARCNLRRRLAGINWGAHIDVLQTSTTTLSFDPAEYCSPVWCRSDHTHRLDAALNNGIRLVSGCIRSTPTFMLPVVSKILPPDIRRNKQCLALSRRAEADDQHALHNIITPGQKRLQPSHPFSEHAKQLTSNATLMERPAVIGQKGPGKRDGTSHAAD